MSPKSQSYAYDWDFGDNRSPQRGARLDNPLHIYADTAITASGVATTEKPTVPVPRSAIIVGNSAVMSTLSMMVRSGTTRTMTNALVMVLVVPLLTIMLRVDMTAELPTIIALLGTGTVGFSVVATPLAVMAVSA